MNTLTPVQEQIAQRAYHLYLENGCQHGRDLDHWLAAEKEIGGKFFTPPPPKKAASRKAPAPKPAVTKKAAAKKPGARKA
ncbi:MAG: DUF2934 domain-containing protein [Verrucomicrobiaceae bacterium]|nr:DUF2934 domain-containing protein [Verrucomicrobiaceae bacterium]